MAIVLFRISRAARVTVADEQHVFRVGMFKSSILCAEEHYETVEQNRTKREIRLKKQANEVSSTRKFSLLTHIHSRIDFNFRQSYLV